MKWYIVRDGEKFGPYSGDDLRRFAGSGHLLPVDLVQQEGRDQPVVASQIKGLFPAQADPPPPPPRPSTAPGRGAAAAAERRPGSQPPDLLARLAGDKLVLLGALLLVAFLFTGCLGVLDFSGFRADPHGGMRITGFLFLLSGLATFGLLVATAVVGMMRLAAWLNRAERRKLLCGLWEPVTGQGMVFQFTEDGGMMRSDGQATKYRWLSDDQEVELYEDGVEDSVRLRIITLSRDELVLKSGGQAAHFRRGTTITEAEMKRRHEETMESLRKLGAGAARVAGGAATVVGGAAALLAVGGLAALCGAAAVASSGSGQVSAGGGGRYEQVPCTWCNQTGWTSTAGKREVCVSCGGKGYHLEK